MHWDFGKKKKKINSYFHPFLLTSYYWIRWSIASWSAISWSCEDFGRQVRTCNYWAFLILLPPPFVYYEKNLVVKGCTGNSASYVPSGDKFLCTSWLNEFAPVHYKSLVFAKCEFLIDLTHDYALCFIMKEEFLLVPTLRNNSYSGLIIVTLQYLAWIANILACLILWRLLSNNIKFSSIKCLEINSIFIDK